MEHLCAICNEVVIKRGVFCKTCYTTYEDDIRNNKDWIKVCRNSEESRRRQEAKNKHLIYLGDNLDVDNSGKLVYMEN
jgi:hypothetical protein